jgi:hypothetical protein
MRRRIFNPSPILDDALWRTKRRSGASEVWTSLPVSPEEFAAHLGAEQKKWGRVINERGIKYGSNW